MGLCHCIKHVALFSCTLHMLLLRFRNDCYRCKVLALDAEHMKFLTPETFMCVLEGSRAR